jgi:5-methyltetrahydrofolate--homocysteine methyltransferase
VKPRQPLQSQEGAKSGSAWLSWAVWKMREVADDFVVYDGAMGTSLQQQNLTAEHFGGEQYNGCNDYLVISYPQAVEAVHRSFLEVGVDVIETDTFRSNRLTLGEYGLQDRVLEINRAAAPGAPAGG